MRILLALLLVCSCALRVSASSPLERTFAPERRAAQSEREVDLRQRVAPERLRGWHDLVAAEPHPAGSVGDRRLIQRLAEELTRMGLDVEVQWFHALLAHPVDAELELIDGPERSALALKEPPVEGDPWSADEALSIGFNAYSASADVTARYVYANYGTLEDFEELERLGVDVRGSIVIARYGRNFRGYKARFAQEAGAVGLVMFTDPEDSGDLRGAPYPAGGWANEHAIQRGSVSTGGAPGDPLTPGVFASEDAPRRAVDDADLPTIPVQPIGYAAAAPILRAMTGEQAPHAWQGGIDTVYALTSGDAKLRLRVEQERRITRTANVIASLAGAKEPAFEVIAGCHHDAWTHGAGDPGAGTMVLIELARVFAARAREGDRPDRTLRFAFWGAEEHAIVGSTEYVEQRERELGLGAVAYINLDMAAMGPRLWASATPSLADAVRDAARVVDGVGDNAGSAYESWLGDREEPAPVGTLGGGSDHVAFICRVGVPCVAIGSTGAPGVSYHSAHDTLGWYRLVVGEDYEPAAMVTRVAAVLMSRLAYADVLPLEPWAYARPVRDAHAQVEDSMRALREDACARVHASWAQIERTRSAFEAARERVIEGAEPALALNSALMRCDRAWIEREGRGLPERDWYRNHFVSPAERSGYSAWVLPGIRAALVREDAALLGRMVRIVSGAGGRIEAASRSLGPIGAVPE